MEELVGISVLVHPNLTSDPVNMQGQTGTISHVLYEDGYVYVKFQNQMLALYDMGALLMLVPGEIIVDKLKQDAIEKMLSRLELVKILNIYLLNSSGQREQQEKALDLATDNVNVMEAIVFTVRDWIEFQIDRLDQQQEPGRGR